MKKFAKSLAVLLAVLVALGSFGVMAYAIAVYLDHDSPVGIRDFPAFRRRAHLDLRRIFLQHLVSLVADGDDLVAVFDGNHVLFGGNTVFF